MAARPLSLGVPGIMLIASSVKNAATDSRAWPAVQWVLNAAQVAAMPAFASCTSVGRCAQLLLAEVRTAATTAKERCMDPPVVERRCSLTPILVQGTVA